MTTKQAAELLRLSKRTLERLRVAGNGPPFVKPSSRAVRYRLEDLQAWCSGRVVRSTSEGLAQCQS
jgi:excisionase family DNA binding protein